MSGGNRNVSHLSRGNNCALRRFIGDSPYLIRTPNPASRVSPGAVLPVLGKIIAPDAGRDAESIGPQDENRFQLFRAGRNSQVQIHVFLAAIYAALDRQEDAKRERAIVARMWPFLDARAFADQFGTEEARRFMFEGLKKAGFR